MTPKSDPLIDILCGFQGAITIRRTCFLEFGKLRKMAQWLSWLERRPVTAEVVSSSLIWVACEEDKEKIIKLV